MNRLFPIFFLTLLSFLFIVLQCTLFSPRHFGVFNPDLNLIFIVFLGLFSEVKGSAIIALGSGYMMDVLSGYVLGVHSLSRFSVFVMLKAFSPHVYSQSRITQAIAIFFSTLFLWGFIWTGLKVVRAGFGISFGDMMAQGMVNTLVGLPVFWVIKKLYARVQE